MLLVLHFPTGCFPLSSQDICSIVIIYRNLFLQTLFLWPQTGGWPLCRSHMPEEQRQMRKSRNTGEQEHLLLLLSLNGTITGINLFLLPWYLFSTSAGNIFQPFIVCLKENDRRLSDLLVFFQGHARFSSIWSFNENQLVSLNIFQDSLQTYKNTQNS